MAEKEDKLSLPQAFRDRLDKLRKPSNEGSDRETLLHGLDVLEALNDPNAKIVKKKS